MSRGLVGNLDAPKVLSDQIFASKTSGLAHIFRAILNPDPNEPRVYAVDTEFYRPSTKGSSIFSEVAFIEVKNGQIVMLFSMTIRGLWRHLLSLRFGNQIRNP